MTFTIAQIILLVTAFVFLLAVAFVIGWNIAVARWRAGRRQLNIRVDDLEQQVQAFNEAAQTDPERGWMNTGAFYALNQIEMTAKRIRAELERRER